MENMTHGEIQDHLVKVKGIYERVKNTRASSKDIEDWNDFIQQDGVGKLIDIIESLVGRSDRKITVHLFKSSGKYYTEELWDLPIVGSHVSPDCMKDSPTFRRIGGTGAVLIPSQEPWGYPHLFPAIK
ncbi:hypothetical protein SEA_JUMBO_84 [Gordonia phage Jumbo]|uniref:Uncharacterized protein n=1 Tax=Gordonia phage Jumbo TaxID=1887650 RepID=A0A1B3B0R9_9CAUD|nr:hypothetical protein BIZ69_gp084 [Gordonia phage Jumbo]AOE44592.1 hypothetical protein SEA_JUMBO_84 [Gordonia phage Jumbo]